MKVGIEDGTISSASTQLDDSYTVIYDRAIGLPCTSGYQALVVPLSVPFERGATLQRQLLKVIPDSLVHI